jgi:hypothetical protein
MKKQFKLLVVRACLNALVNLDTLHPSTDLKLKKIKMNKKR